MSEIECRYRVSPALLEAAINAGAAGKGRGQRPAWWIPMWVVVGVAIGFAVVVAGSLYDTKVPALAIFFGSAGFLAGLALWQVTWKQQLLGILAAHEEAAEKAGEVVSRFGPDGIDSRSALGQSFSKWPGIGAVLEIPGGTAIRMGATSMPVPDEALPEGMGGPEFRARLDSWRVAG